MNTDIVSSVLAKHKELTVNGFETSLMRLLEQKRTGVKPLPAPPPTLQGTQMCIDWLLQHDAFDRRKTINFNCSSYGWKHKVEESVGEYVSNGEFICAALYLGYKMVRPDKHSPNAHFNIRSIKR